MEATLSRPDETEQMDAWVRDHGPAVRAYLQGVVRSPHQAEDLLQDVFCRAWQSRDRYLEQGYARAYLIRIADHAACDHLRRKKSQTLGEEVWSLQESSEKADPVKQAVDSETNEQLRRALDRLTSIQRRILLLRYFGEFTFAEIAEMVDCPLNTTLSHCHRGLQALRKEFAGNP